MGKVKSLNKVDRATRLANLRTRQHKHRQAAILSWTLGLVLFSILLTRLGLRLHHPQFRSAISFTVVHHMPWSVLTAAVTTGCFGR